MISLKQLQKTIAVMVFAVACILLLSASVVRAQNSFEQEQQALNMIADFADRICKDIPLQGKEDNLELTGTAKAELRGIVKKFADLGLEGAAKYKTSKYEGLIQGDLLKALQNSASCKLKVFESLKDKLLTSKVTVAPLKPNPPSQFNINWEKGKGFLLVWADNSVNELGFNIYRKYESNPDTSLPPLTGKAPSFKLARTVPINTTEYFDHELFFFGEGDKVFYQISSYNETGESERIEFGYVSPRGYEL